MSAGQPHGLIARQTLSAAELEAVGALAAICNRHDQLNLKINWDLLETRDGAETRDLLYYRQGELVGYLAIDGFGQEVELTGMVHPAVRRRGIFRALLAAARQDYRRRGVSQALLVCERASVSGQAFVQASGARYRFSEYHLELNLHQSAPLLPADALGLREAGVTDRDLLTQLQMDCFADSEEQARGYVLRDLAEEQSRTYIASLGAEPLGKIGAVFERSGVYIRGFGVLPAFRRCGYGRQILATLIRQLHAQGRRQFALDVVCDNTAALSLYQACAFQETNRYDYYDLALD